jgi:hypothetical protein
VRQKPIGLITEWQPNGHFGAHTLLSPGPFIQGIKQQSFYQRDLNIYAISCQVFSAGFFEKK